MCGHTPRTLINGFDQSVASDQVLVACSLSSPLPPAHYHLSFALLAVYDTFCRNTCRAHYFRVLGGTLYILLTLGAQNRPHFTTVRKEHLL
jgi:hypothetical protein